ncbi:hypothetical protein ACJX0J_031543, partial [Zea mays]
LLLLFEGLRGLSRLILCFPLEYSDPLFFVSPLVVREPTLHQDPDAGDRALILANEKRVTSTHLLRTNFIAFNKYKHIHANFSTHIEPIKKLSSHLITILCQYLSFHGHGVEGALG